MDNNYVDKKHKSLGDIAQNDKSSNLEKITEML